MCVFGVLSYTQQDSSSLRIDRTSSNFEHGTGQLRRALHRLDVGWGVAHCGYYPELEGVKQINDHVTSKVDKTMRLVPIPVKPPLRLLSEGCALFLQYAGWDFHENSISHYVSNYQGINYY